jgi:hypothetical protein
MKKYYANGWYNPKVEIVEIIKETDACVWDKNGRHLKKTAECGYFKSFSEAKDFLVAIYTEKLKKAKTNYDYAVEKYNDVRYFEPTERAGQPAKSAHKFMDLTNPNVFRNGSMLG